tara:strand:+ start:10352 stop:15634 length:5283 start_codon:yes stop_codon:yes gene_type:complete
MNVKRNTTYKRKQLSTSGIIELHALYKDTPLETTGSTFKIQGKANANRFVVSGQVGDAPEVGSGELKSAHLRLYVSGTELSNTATLPTTSLFKIKDNDVSLTEGQFKLAITGDNAPAKRDTPGQISIFTTYADTNTAYLTEDFSGNDKTLGSNFIKDSGGGTTVTKMYPYLDPEDPKTAETLFVGGTQSWLNFIDDDYSTAEVLRRYFSTQQVGTLNQDRSGNAYRLFIKPAKSHKPQGLWKNLNDNREGSHKFTIYPPFWRWDHIKSIVHYASEVSTPNVSVEDAESEPTTNNTIFNLLRFTPSNGTAWEGSVDNPSPWCVTDMKLNSDKYDTGGQSLKMYHLWNFAKPESDAAKLLNSQDALFGLEGSTNTQFTCASADIIPYPIGLDHTFSSDYTQVAGAAASDVINMIKPEINIDFSINQLDNNPTWSFNNAVFSNVPSTGLATAIASATVLTVTGTSFSGWPSEGFALIQSGTSDTVAEYVKYSSRSDTVLTMSSTADRGLFSTTAQAISSATIYQASQYMQLRNYCSGSIGEIPVGNRLPYAADAAIRSSSYKTLLRNFTVTLSNYAPEEGEPLDEFLDRGLSSFYSGSGDGIDNIVGGFTIQRTLGKTGQNDSASSNKVTAYPLYTRPSHYIASGNSSLGGGLFGWDGYVNRGLPFMAMSGASAFNNTDMTYTAGGAGNMQDFPSARVFLNGAARLKQTAWTENKPDEYYEPSVNLSMDEFINAKIVFDMGAQNSVGVDDDADWFDPSPAGQRLSEAGMCKVFFTKGFSNYKPASDGDGDSIAYSTPADDPPSIPIYFPCLSGSSKAWDWQTTPSRWPNILTVWLTNYRFFMDDETVYSSGSTYLSATTRSGLTNKLNDAGVYRAGYGLQGDYPLASADDGSSKTSEAYIDKIELRNFGFEIFNNSASTGMFTLPMGLKSNTVDTPMNQRDSSNQMPYPNPIGDKLYVRSAPTYITFGFDDKATLPQVNGNNRYSWLMWNGFSRAGPAPRYTLNTLQGWKSMVSGAIATAADAKYVNYFGGQTLQAGNTVGRTASGGFKSPVTVQGLTVDLGAPTGNGSETNKLFFTSGTAMTSLGNDALTQKGTSYMCIQSNADETTDGAWAKRENIFVSARIQDIPSFVSTAASTLDDIPKNTVVVDNPSIFEVGDDTDGPFYVIWKQQVAAANDAAVTAATKSAGRSPHMSVSKKDGNMITFNTDLGDLTDVTNLVSLANLPYLMAGPVKYWVTMQVFGGPAGEDIDGATGLPYVVGTLGESRTYDNVCVLGNTSVPTESMTGSTWNESTYSYNSSLEASGGRSGAYGRTWILDVTDDGNLEVKQDYGHGAYDEETNMGGDLDKTIPYVDTISALDISGLVSSVSPGDDFKMVLGLSDPQAQQNVEFVNSEYSEADTINYDIIKPHLLWGYKDEVPKIKNFRVAPLFNVLESGTNLYELTNEDLRSVKFTWDEEADDIWYRMLMIDVSGNTIRNKYHNARFVIKGNEPPQYGPTSKPYTYRYNFTTTPAVNDTLTIGSDIRALITGRQGYAIQTASSSTAANGVLVSAYNSTNWLGWKNLQEWTYVCHLTPSANDAGHDAYFTSFGTALEMYINDDGSIKIEFGGSLKLQSVSRVVYDGETPTSVIVTYNDTNPDGKYLKLYIDGVLEDTSEFTTTISSNSNITIGGKDTPTSASCYRGLIEEVILYDRCYYIPATAGEYTFKAANVHSTRGNSEDKKINTNEYLVHSAKLFAFDYTNIRGTTQQEVGSSKQTTWKVTSV